MIKYATVGFEVHRRWYPWMFFLMVFTFPFVSTVSASEEVDELRERIDELESIVEDISEQVGSRTLVHSFDSLKFNIGGFLHTAYTYIDTDVDSDLISDPDSAGSFNRQNFELLISATLNEDWSAFVATGFLRESDDAFVNGSRYAPEFNSKNKNPLIIGWVNYEHSDAFNIRTGRMITPHGIINVEHFPATLLETEQPQFLRPFSGNTIFSNFSTGIQVHGSIFFDNGADASYAAYFTNTSSSPEDKASGLRAAVGAFDGAVEVGLNTFNGVRSETVDSYRGQGVDLKISKGKLLWKSEYYKTSGEVEGNRIAAYTQPAWQITPKWIVFYRYDRLDSGDFIGTSVENVVGANYLPFSNTRLRVTLTSKEFEGGVDENTGDRFVDVSARIIQFSGTFSF